MHALDYVQAIHQTQAASTTSLVNLVSALTSMTIACIPYPQPRHDGYPRHHRLSRERQDLEAFLSAAFPEVLGVCSSTRHTRVKAAYSNFGPWVSLCAPGLQYVTRPLQPGDIASGTSFASPMVAGALGQLLLDAPVPAHVRAGEHSGVRLTHPPRTSRTWRRDHQQHRCWPVSASLYTCQSHQGCGSADSPGCSAWGLAWLRISA